MVAAPSAHATYPGANGKIAFDCGDANSNGICVSNPDGTATTRLVTNPYKVYFCFNEGCYIQGASDGFPRWSADGRSLIFLREIGSTDPYPRLGDFSFAYFRVNADGSGLTELSNTQDIGRLGAVGWSPDGQRIAFVVNNSKPQIAVQDVDGTQRSDITAADAYALEPAWSPDGSTIAYAFSHPAFSGQLVPSDIHLINPDGTNDRAITSADPNCGVDSFYSEPNWSPDGRRLVAAKNASCNTVSPNIVVMNADGSGITKLTNICCTTSDGNPVWSPDGTQIVFNRADNGQHLIVMNADGSNQHEIHPGESRGFGYQPDWQPIVNQPPDCAGVAASRSVLSTANHRLVPITLDGATDPDGNPVTLSVDGVTQDEPVLGSGDNTSPDAVDQGDGQLRVRAERDPHGDGRVYRIAFTASDGRGGSCSGTAKVSVTRKKRKAAVDSAPPSYDSFGR
jgi:Tol biopolymer transport system component